MTRWPRTCQGARVSWVLLLLLLAPGFAAAEPRVAAEAEAELAASPEAVRALLLDLEGFAAWFPTLVEWRVLERGEGQARVYGRQHLPWPVADRDYVARYRWWSEGGVFRLEAVGETGARPPPPEGVVRLERFRSEWRVAAAPGGGARTRYRAEGAVEGRLVRWLTRIAWRGETRRVLDGLAEALGEERPD